MYSIIICTYNRALCLRGAIETVLESVSKARQKWELIIVDNNSSDDTKNVVKDISRSNPAIHYYFVREQGLSFARNKGVEEAKGKYVIFTDDDVLVDKEWFSEMCKCIEETEAQAVGGRILPNWGANCPKWLSRNMWGMLALLDLGDERAQLNMPKLWGANLALEKKVISDLGGFDVRKGRKGRVLYSGEETGLLQRIIDIGGKLFYEPRAMVRHIIEEDRMKIEYFRNWERASGIQNGKDIELDNHRVFIGRPLFFYRQMLEATYGYIVHAFSIKGRVPYDLKIRYLIGLNYGIRLKKGGIAE